MQIKRSIPFLCILFFTACAKNSIFSATGPAPSTPPASQKKSADRPAPPATSSSEVPKLQEKSKAGGYYLDDGPAENTPTDIDNIPDAIVKTEAPLTRANKPYSAVGQQYTPMTKYEPYKKQGIASWYGKRYHGKKTSTGEVYDMFAMSGAHTILPIPSYAKVTNPANGRSVVVRINDRGPFKDGRLIDLSYAAAYKLRLTELGSGLVEVEAIDSRAEVMQKASNTPTANKTSSEVSANNAVNEVQTSPVISTPEVNSVTSTTATSTMQYFVQVGAFRSEANSNLLQKKIQGLDLAKNVGLANVYNNALYRVMLGPYPNKEDAVASSDNIHKQLNISAIVIKQ